MKKLLLIATLSLFSLKAVADTTFSLSVQWEHDGLSVSNLPIEISKYKIYADGSVVGETSEKTLSLDNLSSLPKEIRVTAVSAEGIESNFSEPYFVKVDLPSSPKDVSSRVKVTITW